MTICLCLISTSLVTNAYSTQNISKQNDVCFEMGKIVDDSRISNVDQVNTKFSEFRDKPSVEEIREVISRINPNSIVLDINEMKNIRTPEDLIKAFEKRNIELHKNLDTGSLFITILEIETFVINNNSDVYLILEYDQMSGQILRNPTKWCDFCLLQVIASMLGFYLEAPYLGFWGPSYALLINKLMVGYCPNCEAKLMEYNEVEFIEYVPICPGCNNYYSWINQAYYCETCEVWN